MKTSNLTKWYQSNTHTQCGWGLVLDTQMESSREEFVHQPSRQVLNHRATDSEGNTLEIKLQSVEGQSIDPFKAK